MTVEVRQQFMAPRFKRCLGFVILAAFVASPAASQALSDADIKAAIAAGTSRKTDALIATCTARSGSRLLYANRKRALRVSVLGTKGRIAALAADAKRRYVPFVIDDVPQDLRQEGVSVEVDPAGDLDMRYLPPKIDHVVLKGKPNADDVIQPTSIASDQVSFANLVGGKAERNRVVARFDATAVMALPGKEIIVTVITPDGEHQCAVDRAVVMR